MRTSRILTKLSRNEPVLITTLRLASPAVFELTSLMGFDGIWIDLEHHAHSLETATNLMRAARVGTADILARPAKGEFMRLARLLEAGAQGIIYPRCDNAAEARQLVQAAKFPPVGQRGADCGNPDVPYNTIPIAEYVKLANENTFVLAMIEEQHAADAAEEILAVPGIAGVFIGTGDFSSFGGYPGQMNHPKLQASIAHVAEAAKRTGKHWGLPVGNAEDAAKYLAMGARIFNHSSDLQFVKSGLENVQKTFGSVGFKFG